MLRWLLQLLAFCLLGGWLLAEALGAPPLGNYGHRRGLWRKIATTFSSASTLENPGAADLVLTYGQSSSTGFCDSGVGSPFTCNQPRPGPFAAGHWMACYDPVNDDYSEPLVALDLTNTSCRRWQYQQPMATQAEYWRQRTGRTPATITCPSPGQPGISILGLSDPSIHWTRLVSCVTETFNRVTADPTTFGASGTPALIVRHLHMVQGESDDGTVSRNNNYTAEVLDFVDDFQTMVKGITGQVSDVIITWDNPSNWQENDSIRCPTCTQLRDAAAQRSFLYNIGSKGHANPDYPGGTAGVISFEHGGASALHWSPAWHVLEGYHAAKHGYCALFGGCPVGGPRIVSASWDGTDVVLTYDRDLTLDDTFCPAHWNGDNGFELLNVDGPLWDDTVFVGSPAITAVAVSGAEVRLTTDVAPETFTRVEVGNRGLVRTANEPENGCRLGTGGPVNAGAPFVQIYAADTTEYPVTAMESHDWAIMESFGPITGANQPPASTSPGYIEIGTANEHVTFPDETPDALAGSSFTISVWVDTNGSGDGDLIRRGANGSTLFRMFYDHNPGVGGRFDLQIVSTANSSEPTEFVIPENSSDFVNYILIFDGTQSAGSRVRHIYQCEDVADGETGMPTSIPDATGSLFLGFTALGPVPLRYREVAIWAGTVATDAQVLDICQGQLDVTTTSLGTPDYYVRPACNTDLTTASGVVNDGTESAGTGVNHEAGDFVIDRPAQCP